MAHHEQKDRQFPAEWMQGAEVIISPRTPLFGKVISIGPKVVLGDGSFLSEDNDDYLSWNYEEDGEGNSIDKHLDYVMDFSIHFPYWEQVKPPEVGYNHVELIDGIYHWAIREKNF